VVEVPATWPRCWWAKWRGATWRGAAWFATWRGARRFAKWRVVCRLPRRTLACCPARGMAGSMRDVIADAHGVLNGYSRGTPEPWGGTVPQ
jgi:hypothetical protein